MQSLPPLPTSTSPPSPYLHLSRVTANGEMLGLSLVLEDVEQTHSEPSPTPPILTISSSHPHSVTHKAAHSTGNGTSKTSLTGSSLSSHGLHTAPSVESPDTRLKVLNRFLILSLQLEVLRYRVCVCVSVSVCVCVCECVCVCVCV